MLAPPSRSARAYLWLYCKHGGCEWERNCGALQKRREGQGNDAPRGQWSSPQAPLHNLPSEVHTMHPGHRGIAEEKQLSSGVQSPLSSLQWLRPTIHPQEKHQTSLGRRQWSHRFFHPWTESYGFLIGVVLPALLLLATFGYSRWRLPLQSETPRLRGFLYNWLSKVRKKYPHEVPVHNFEQSEETFLRSRVSRLLRKSKVDL